MSEQYLAIDCNGDITAIVTDEIMPVLSSLDHGDMMIRRASVITYDNEARIWHADMSPVGMSGVYADSLAKTVRAEVEALVRHGIPFPAPLDGQR